MFTANAFVILFGVVLLVVVMLFRTIIYPFFSEILMDIRLHKEKMKQEEEKTEYLKQKRINEQLYDGQKDKAVEEATLRNV